MERGLALALFVLVSLGIATVKIFGKSGVLDLRGEWHQYLAAHTTLWLMLVPFIYAALCEMARGSKSPKVVLTMTLALGFVLLALFGFFLASLIFDF